MSTRETRTATIDFTGTSPESASNFNAPSSIVKAAVLYVFRTLVNEDIPLNDGCLEALKIVDPGKFVAGPEIACGGGRRQRGNFASRNQRPLRSAGSPRGGDKEQ